MTNQLTYLYLSFKDIAESLRHKLSSLEGMEYLFHQYGWQVSLNELAFTKIHKLSGIKTPIEQFLQLAGRLQRQLDDNPDSDLELEDLTAIARSAKTLIKALAEFKLSALTELPPPLDRQDFWKSIGDHLFDTLLEEYLRIYHPTAYVALHFWGGIRYEPTMPDGPFRKSYTRIICDWEQVLSIIQNPLSALKQTYWWGDPAKSFEHYRLLEALVRVLRAIHLPAKLIAPSVQTHIDPQAEQRYQIQRNADAMRTIWSYGFSTNDQSLYEIGFELFPATRAGQNVPSGLLIQPILRGGTGRNLPLGEYFALRWNVAGGIDKMFGMACFPDHIGLVGGQAVLGTAVEIVSTSFTPRYLLGNARTTRIEIRNVFVRLSVEGTVDSPEIQVRLATSTANGQPSCKIVIPLDESDGFLNDTLQESAIQFSCSPEIILSNKTGLTFNGKPRLDVDFPLSTKVGIFTLCNAKISVREGPKKTSTPSTILQVGLDIQGKLGPVQIVIQDMGFACHLIPYSRQDILSLPSEADAPVLGNLGLDLSFAPPTGVGLSINAAIVHGGGFLSFDPQQAQYTGAIHLELQGGIAVNALGLITTRLPEGQKGFSLVVVVTAEGFKPLPLGFGFMLTGIGGLLGIHRTAAVEAVQAGVEAHTLDALLSPNDPVRNAPQYLSALSAVFPPARDHHLFGPIVHITWGTPALVTIRLALILELGVRTRFLMFGRLSAILPKRDLDLVRLEMQVAGGIDFDQHSAFLDAVLLPDSRLLHQFVITGEMRMRMSWGRQPYFVLAIGGLHHDFTPPPGLEPLKQMPRLAMILADSDNLKFRCEAYFAITSNTVQFGARVQLFARKWNFSIEGEAGFDVLIQFDPFHFVASLDASLQLKYGDTNLFQVKFAGKLSGPRPLYVSGKATFKIWIFKKSVSFDRTLVEGAGPPLPAAIDVAALLRHALLQPTSWSATIPGRGDRQVSLRETTGTGLLRVHPLSVLALKQNVVPLNVRITKYGTTPVAGGPQEFRIDLVEVGSHPMSIEPVRDHFAPAQFRDMSDEEKLSSRSFELLEAGVRMGADRPDCGTAVVAKVEYEDIVIPEPDPPEDPVRIPPRSGMKAAFAARLAQWSAAGLSPARRRGANPYRGPAIPLPSRPKLFRVISKQDLTTVGEGQTFATRAEASDALRTLRLKKKTGFQIVRDT